MTSTRQKTVALVHTTKVVIEPIEKLFMRIFPEVKLIHLLDEGILRILSKTGVINPLVTKKVCDLVISAEDANVDLIMTTCSSVTPCVDIASKLVNTPVIKIDEFMVDAAVDVGNVIGVVATSNTTLQPTKSFIENVAKEKGRDVVVKTYLCDEAFKSIVAGNKSKHDRIVLKTINEISQNVDVILLAQASLARLVQKIDKKIVKVPVLSSPRMAVENIKKILETQ